MFSYGQRSKCEPTEHYDQTLLYIEIAPRDRGDVLKIAVIDDERPARKMLITGVKLLRTNSESRKRKVGIQMHKDV